MWVEDGNADEGNPDEENEDIAEEGSDAEDEEDDGEESTEQGRVLLDEGADSETSFDKLFAGLSGDESSSTKSNASSNASLKLYYDSGGERDPDQEGHANVSVVNPSGRKRNWFAIEPMMADKKSAPCRTDNFSEELVCFLAEKAKEGLGNVVERFQPGFAALHLIVLLSKQLPTTFLFGRREVLEKLVEVAYRCASIDTASDSISLDKVSTNLVEDLFSEDFNFKDEKVKAIFYTLAHECSPHEHLQVLKLIGTHLLDLIRIRATQNESPELFTSCLRTVRKDLLHLRSERAIKRTMRKSSRKSGRS